MKKMSLTLLITHQARGTVGKQSVTDDSDSLLLLHLDPSQAHHGQEPQDRHHRAVGLCHGSLQPRQVTVRASYGLVIIEMGVGGIMIP